MKKLISKMEWIFTQGGWLGGVASMVMMLVIMREVVGRYLFNSPTDWALELGGYLLVAIVYIGGPWVAMIDGHIRIDFVYILFRGRLKKAVDIIVYLVSIFYCGILTWQGWEQAYYSLKHNILSAEAMMWPLFPSQVLVPIGALGTLLVLIVLLVRCITGKQKDIPAPTH